MRKEQRQPAQAAPFRLARANELIDDHLCAIGEVAKLPFPDDQRIGLGGCEAILKPHDRLFRQQGIGNRKPALPGRQVFQWHIGFLIRLIVQHRVAVEECTARAVLAGQPDFIAFIEQACIGNSFREAPVDRQFAGRHFPAVFQDPLYPGVDGKMHG